MHVLLERYKRESHLDSSVKCGQRTKIERFNNSNNWEAVEMGEPMETMRFTSRQL